MKKIFVLLAIATSLNSYAAGPTEKILKCFETSFPKAENISWKDVDKNSQVTFNNGQIKCSLWYDTDGNIVRTIRYYTVESLSPFILAKISQFLPDKKVFGITELSSEDGMYYYITLEDSDKWYQVKADTHGNISMENKFKKA